MSKSNKEVSEETTENKNKKAQSTSLRWNKKFRLAVIGALMIIVVVLFFVWEKARIFLAVAFFTLLAAFGLEVTENDWDIGKLIETGSFQESKIGRDESGNLLYDIAGNVTTDPSKGKPADEYNCSDFETQPEAQLFFDRLGGTENDINRLDGDKDGEACEALPKGK